MEGGGTLNGSTPFYFLLVAKLFVCTLAFILSGNDSMRTGNRKVGLSAKAG